ncbi:hypothetical protein K504DRAFT_122824 [Pleomassaria siparia CBS 279.74]|uniref:Uncharacterized protein n=1 Tax=Pleomassaria siparia CBS 279.74 TaxID=1314801 RepID=A0A6G1KIY8_9PLEO|nr:hypothetical protein K504DRAFT_122824 [Pleomassaria siparia CBS 279.74]
MRQPRAVGERSRRWGYYAQACAHSIVDGDEVEVEVEARCCSLDDLTDVRESGPRAPSPPLPPNTNTEPSQPEGGAGILSTKPSPLRQTSWMKHSRKHHDRQSARAIPSKRPTTWAAWESLHLPRRRSSQLLIIHKMGDPESMVQQRSAEPQFNYGGSTLHCQHSIHSSRECFLQDTVLKGRE